MSGSQIQAINGASWIGSPRKVTPTIRFLTVFAWWLKQVVWRSPILTSHPTDEWECVWRVPYYSRMTICIQIHIYIYTIKNIYHEVQWVRQKFVKQVDVHPGKQSSDHTITHRDPTSFFVILARVYGLPTVYLRSTYGLPRKQNRKQTNQHQPAKIAYFQRWTSKSIKFRWIWVKVTSNGMVHAENYQDLRSGFTFCPRWAIQIVTCHLSLPTAS